MTVTYDLSVNDHLSQYDKQLNELLSEEQGVVIRTFLSIFLYLHFFNFNLLSSILLKLSLTKGLILLVVSSCITMSSFEQL